MIYILHFKSEDTFLERIGAGEIQHYSPMKHFLPLLKKRGTVVFIEKINAQVNGVYELANYLGTSCLFISFSPPDVFYSKIRCPKMLMTSMIQYQEVHWCHQQKKLAEELLTAGIKESQAGIADCEASHEYFTKMTDRKIQTATIPPPLWDTFQALYEPNGLKSDISTNGDLIDSRLPRNRSKFIAYPIPLFRRIESIRAALKLSQKIMVLKYLLMRKNIHYYPRQLILNGVVYTAVVSAAHPFKNWRKLIADFCSVFKHKEDAVLVIKMVGWTKERIKKEGLRQLKWKSFKCRIIIIYEHLPMEQYENLIRATDYILNISIANEIGNSLLEFMSAGKPAISLKHPEMQVLNRENAFIIPAQKEKKLSIKSALQQSYNITKNEPQIYQRMVAVARNSMKIYCSKMVIEPKLSAFLDKIEEAIF